MTLRSLIIATSVLVLLLVNVAVALLVPDIVILGMLLV